MYTLRDMDATTLQSRLGAALRQARLQRGLTQAAVAERAGIPRLKVIQAERGDGSVAMRYYAGIAAALDQQMDLAPARRPTLDELRAWNEEQ